MGLTPEYRGSSRPSKDDHLPGYTAVKGAREATKNESSSASDMGHSLCEFARIPIFIRRAEHFMLPKEDPVGTPLVLVGPGPGVAPFRGCVLCL